MLRPALCATEVPPQTAGQMSVSLPLGTNPRFSREPDASTFPLIRYELICRCPKTKRGTYFVNLALVWGTVWLTSCTATITFGIGWESDVEANHPRYGV
jgi:hypothetical protein